MILDNPNIPDPPIKMRVICVMFDEPEHNYRTNINGTRAEIADYFRGARLDVGVFPEETIRTPNRIEFLDGYEEPVAVELR